jgi:uroporphyrinogen decarboxylase
MMNSLQRFNALRTGQAQDRFLNFDILMSFAAHQIGKPLQSYYLDYRVLCEANLAAQVEFSLDIVQAISDPYREAADAGLEVEFPPDGLPLSKNPLIRGPDDVKRLVFPAPAVGKRMSDRLEAVRYLRQQVGNEVPVMGWVEGALAEAADLRGVSSMLIDLVDQPDWLEDLLERCAENAIAFARAQIEAGAHMIGLGDALASQVSPRMYRQYALPYEQRIFAAVREMGAVPRLHICGNTTRILKDMAASGAEIIDVDWMVDLQQAASITGCIVCGNLDPVAVFLQGTPRQVREGILANSRAAAPRWISMAGCEIPDKTPPGNLHAQSQALVDFYAH